jgi:hypothetical protein
MSNSSVSGFGGREVLMSRWQRDEEPACVDVSQWSKERLDDQALTLRTRLRNEDNPNRADDLRQLTQVEAEIERRQGTDHTPQVELCSRPAELPGAKQLGLRHHWIRTTHVEAGMGAKGRGVPGKDGHVDPPGIPTTVNDHRGEGVEKGQCVVIPDADEACVEKQLTIGRETGTWLPWNQCQTFAKEVLDACRPSDPPAPLPVSKPMEPKL